MMPQNKRGKSPVGQDNRGLNSPAFWEGLMTNSDMPNVAKELVHPGKSGDPLELLMRCIIKDERQLNAIVQYFALCDEFDLPQEKRALVYRLAGSVSIDGLSRKELSMVSTGIIAPSLWGTRIKDKRRNGKEKDDDKDQTGA
jgi:hypothetical protein